MKKVLVGMSGGVDSSVTAYLLKKDGCEVEGVSFLLYENRLQASPSGCCSLDAIADAGKTAAGVGVRHTVVDLREEFLGLVIEPFIEAYKEGFTPNPCILCNKYIKFPWLLKLADERDAGYIATGHYARATSEAGLGKGIDARKDQSYVLYTLRKEELSRLILPLGDRVKQEVRETAARLLLPAAARPESQEICFIGGRNYCTFLDGLAEKAEGPIVDVESMEVLGTHRGIHLYTVGQRKRLGLAVGKPLYVARIDTAMNTIYVGSREAAMKKAFRVEGINWLVPAARDFRAGVKVRSTMKEEPAVISLVDQDIAEVVYDEPQWAPAPGQSAVFYLGDRVVGGGIISSVH